MLRSRGWQTLRSTVALTTGRGRGKSAALGLALAAAVAAPASFEPSFVP